MPYITVESGALSDEQKELLIKRLTEVSSEIMKVPQEFFVTTIKEVSDKNFGIGGKTIDIVKEEYVKKHQQFVICEMRGISIMSDQSQEMREYIKFWTKFLNLA